MHGPGKNCLVTSFTLSFVSHVQIRKNTADQLYTTLLTYDHLLPEDILDDIIIIPHGESAHDFCQFKHAQHTMCGMP